LPILYVVAELADNEVAMSRLNASQRIWRLFDFVLLYAKQGIPCYTKIVEINEAYNLGDTNSIAIVLGCKGNVKNIKTGYNFPINNKINSILLFITKAKEYLYFYKSTNFVYSIIQIHNKLEISQINRIMEQIPSMKEQAAERQYLLMFENLYNRDLKKQSNKISLTL